MQQEFEPKLSRDILKMPRSESFYLRARFEVIYSAFKTKQYFLKNSTMNLLVPKIQTGVSFYLIVIYF